MKRWPKVRSSSFLCVFGEEKDSESRFYVSGYGAAGGLGFAFLTFMDAQLESGIQIVAKRNRLGVKLQRLILITGKAYGLDRPLWKRPPVGIARLRRNMETGHCICRGCCAWRRACNEQGIDAFSDIKRGGSLEAANEVKMRRQIWKAAEQVVELLRRLWPALHKRKFVKCSGLCGVCDIAACQEADLQNRKIIFKMIKIKDRNNILCSLENCQI